MPRTLIHRIKLSHHLKPTERKRVGMGVMRLARKQGLKPVWGKGGLSHSISIYVPSTKRADVLIPKKKFRERVRMTEDFLRARFGGETTVFGSGTWFSSKRQKLIREPIAIVQSYAPVSALKRYRSQLRDFTKAEKRKWGQESLSVAQDRRLYFV